MSENLMYQPTLKWITPNAEKLIAEIARVSNPSNEKNPKIENILSYMVKHKHWSPFEMASACIEIITTRDIARQILRHRSFSFQEFSQRYADPSQLGEPSYREARMQDKVNRQSSHITNDEEIKNWFKREQQQIYTQASALYQTAIARGVAKEQARVFLPEGLTPSRLYMAGTIRSWLHYTELRTGNGTQKEHQDIAKSCRNILSRECPLIFFERSSEQS